MGSESTPPTARLSSPRHPWAFACFAMAMVLPFAAEGQTADHYRIQIAAASDSTSFDALRQRVRQVIPGRPGLYVTGESGLYKLRLGDFPTRAAARTLLALVRANGFPDAWLAKSSFPSRRVAARSDRDVEGEAEGGGGAGISSIETRSLPGTDRAAVRDLIARHRIDVSPGLAPGAQIPKSVVRDVPVGPWRRPARSAEAVVRDALERARLHAAEQPMAEAERRAGPADRGPAPARVSAGGGGGGGGAGPVRSALRPLEGAIRLDGRLDDAHWRRAEFALRTADGRLDARGAEVALAFDEEALYLAARVTDPPGLGMDPAVAPRLLVSLTPVDGSGLTRTVGVTVDGAPIAYLSPDHAVNASWAVSVAPDARGWTAEFRVPLSFLGPRDPSHWAVRVRHQAPAGP